MKSTRSSSAHSRRDFVKLSGLVAAGYGCLGSSVLSRLEAGITPASVSNPGTLVLNLKDYPALQSNLGSVLIRALGMPASFAKIIVTRLSDTEFAAVTSVCTHAGCTVNPYDISLDAMECNCHGSLYTPQGVVIRGPAQRSLTPYPTTFNGPDQVLIQLPGAKYTVEVAKVTGSNRLSLTFPTTSALKYAVKYRSTVDSKDSTTVSFALTADGVADQVSVTGKGSPISVFIEPAENSGFYWVVRS